jgi:hypothetical protein
MLSDHTFIVLYMYKCCDILTSTVSALAILLQYTRMLLALCTSVPYV